ncbi:hypothetical protein NQ318_017745 [Aromia moschata]|uniref:Uncharacterized protein n=1 Tax=Aromia moschata TaxID=1265417 RepID=A0AAV8YA18_9CUCU|nr:hypothetical protein NQ318_017745 [Aromia moschata]
MSTSIETLSELDLVKTLEKNKQVIEEAEPEELELDFYKASMSIPPRFVPSRISFGFSFSLSFDDLLDEESSSSDETKAGKPPGKHHEEVAAAGEDDHSEEVLRAWFSYHLWHHRMEEMADPNKGWVPFEEAIIESNKEVNALNNTFAPPEAKMEWMDYLEKRKELTKRMKENIFINNCVLLAIKHFYETFLFTLLKIAFRCSHSLITQQVNDKWYVPKIIKTDLKMPKPKKPKKEKKPKEKKPKKEKKAKGAKDKKGKGKGKEKKEKKKKEKPKKLTKEEKAELARLKREQELLEEEERKAEENRRFMFPLGEAATDDFFKGIFENWVKVEKKSKDKKGKKKK